MSVINFSAKQTQATEFAPMVLPEDSYQCVIDRVEMRDGTKYMSTETETQLLFYFKPLGVGKEFENKILFYQTTTSFFNGKSSNAKQSLKPSKLYQLVKTIYKKYKPEVKVDEMEAGDITTEVINELEGKQIMAIVKINENGNNKVSDVLSIKDELKVEGSSLTPDQELEKIMTS